MKFSKEKILEKLNSKLDEKLVAKVKSTYANMFETNDHTNRLKDKVDSLRKDISDLEIRRRNTKNDVFKKTTADQIEAKRSQMRTIQKTLKSQAQKPKDGAKKKD